MVRLFLAFALSCWSLQAFGMEGSDAYVGIWKQTTSNAGYCGNCAVKLERKGKALTIKANNGWIAVVWPLRTTKPDIFPSLEGAGTWVSSRDNNLRGKEFHIAVSQEAGVMRIYMLLSDRTGAMRRSVKAEYVLVEP